MNKRSAELMPQARSENLVVEILPDETLVYDLKRHRAHCLNRAATLVWRHCDGRTPLAAMAAILEEELQLPSGDALVRTGLDQLLRAHLVHGVAPWSRYSRREVLRTLGLSGAAALVPPLVDSIVSPVAAQAGSCVTGEECRARIPPFCSGLPICGDPGRCCQRRGIRCRQGPC